MPQPKPLARVTDPEALEAAPGPRAELSIEVPTKWLRNGAELEVVAPKRLACGRCNGGGCDSCERAGVWRAPHGAAGRTLRLQLPPVDEGGVILRLVAPFEDSDIEQLFVNVRSGENPSKGVRRLPQPQASLAIVQRPKLSLPPEFWVVAAMAAAAAAAVAAWL